MLIAVPAVSAATYNVKLVRDWVDVTTVVIAICAAVVIPVIIAYVNGRREQWKQVLDTLDYISSGEVQKARHRLGTFVESALPRESLSVHSQRKDELMGDLFTILWAFQRIHSVWQSLGTFAWAPRMHLYDATLAWVKYWACPQDGNLSRICKVRAALGADIEGSDEGLYRLMFEFAPCCIVLLYGISCRPRGEGPLCPAEDHADAGSASKSCGKTESPLCAIRSTVCRFCDKRCSYARVFL